MTTQQAVPPPPPPPTGITPPSSSQHPHHHTRRPHVVAGIGILVAVLMYLIVFGDASSLSSARGTVKLSPILIAEVVDRLEGNGRRDDPIAAVGAASNAAVSRSSHELGEEERMIVLGAEALRAPRQHHQQPEEGEEGAADGGVGAAASAPNNGGYGRRRRRGSSGSGGGSGGGSNNRGEGGGTNEQLSADGSGGRRAMSDTMRAFLAEADRSALRARNGLPETQSTVSRALTRTLLLGGSSGSGIGIGGGQSVARDEDRKGADDDRSGSASSSSLVSDYWDLGTCPSPSTAGTSHSVFRSSLKHISGSPAHAFCGVVISNMCYKNARPLVFTDDATPKSFPRPPNVPEWPLDDEERAVIADLKNRKKGDGVEGGGGGGGSAALGAQHRRGPSTGLSRSSIDGLSQGTLISPFQLTNGGSIYLCNEAVKLKPRFQMKEYYPRAYEAVVLPALARQREEWALRQMIPMRPPNELAMLALKRTFGGGGGEGGPSSGDGLSSSSSSSSSLHHPTAPYAACDNKVLVAPFCWELYGYHLVLCIMSMHAHLQRLGLGHGSDIFGVGGSAAAGISAPHQEEGEATKNGNNASKANSMASPSVPRFIVAIAKSSKQFPYMTGSATSWFESERGRSYGQSSSSSSSSSDGSSSGDTLAAIANTMPSRSHGSQYWRLWQVIADSPADVFPDSDVPAQCFRLAVIGSPASFSVSNDEGKAFRLALIKRLALKVRKVKRDAPLITTADRLITVAGGDTATSSSSSSSNAHDDYTNPLLAPTVAVSLASDDGALAGVGALIQCRKYRVVLIEREKRYQIINLAELAAQIQCVLSGGAFHATMGSSGDGDGGGGAGGGHNNPSPDQQQQRRAPYRCEYEANDGSGNNNNDNKKKSRLFSFKIAVLERMSLEEQLALAVNTDLFIAVHGNGLTWSAIMPTGGAVIELWPNRAYNANYERFAQRNALLKVNVEANNGGCKQRCPMHYAIPPEAFERIIAHLDGVSCR